MKGFQGQKSLKTLKASLNEYPLRISTPKHSALRFNKENERNDEILHLNRQTHQDSEEMQRKPSTKSSCLNINSPKGNTTKSKPMFSPQHTEVEMASTHKVVRKKRTDEFTEVHNRIADLEEKLEVIRKQFRKKPETGQRKEPERKQKSDISKSRSVERLPMKPLEIENTPCNINVCPSSVKASLNEKSSSTSSAINSFVTQMPSPNNPLQCSSSTNLGFVTKLKSQGHKYYVSRIVSAFCDKVKTSFTNLCRTHLMNSLQLLNSLKSVEKPEKVKPLFQLPPTNRKTIVFDLDETLIHCNQTVDVPHDEKLTIPFPNGQLIKVGINVRPWARECLRELADTFEIIIFTASHECYGNVVADYLDPLGTIVAARYFRDSCHRTADGFYVKDLRVIDRPLENMLLIDNAAYSYAFQLDNGVPIIPFYESKSDNELRHLVDFLRGLGECGDIRKAMCSQLRVDEYCNFVDPQQLIQKLYANEIR